VSSVNCHSDPAVCHFLQPQSSILFYQAEHFPSNESYAITSTDPKEIVSQVLGLLPDLNLLSTEQLNVRINLIFAILNVRFLLYRN